MRAPGFRDAAATGIRRRRPSLSGPLVVSIFVLRPLLKESTESVQIRPWPTPDTRVRDLRYRTMIAFHQRHVVALASKLTVTVKRMSGLDLVRGAEHDGIAPVPAL